MSAPWSDSHLTPVLLDELHQRLERYRIEACALFGDDEAGETFRTATAEIQKQVLAQMMGERIEAMRLALTSAQDSELDEGALPVSPLIVSLITLPAEVQLLREAIAQP